MSPVAQRAARRLPVVLFVTLLVMWLLLNGTLGFGHVLLGAVLAAPFALASAALRPPARFRRMTVALGLLLAVLTDIVRSNVGVARIVLGLVRDRAVRSGFVEIPLELRDPHALAVLAAIVTATPGTVWVNLDHDTNTLALHVLDLKDEAAWIDWIKGRYERPLRRIFE